MPKKKTHDEFVRQMLEINPEIVILGHYQNTNTPIECRCSKCGHVWKARPYSLLQRKGCARCAGNLKRNHEEFLHQLRGITSSVVVLEPYVNDSTRLKCRCEKCGYVWNVKPNDLLHGHGCPKCAKVALKTHNEFVTDVARVHSDVEVVGKYIRSSERVACSCKRCGHRWNPVANSLLTGRGCPECSKSSTSFMEQFLLLSLRRALGRSSVLHRDRKAIGKELDIYIPSLSVAIEPGAWHWHKDKLSNDQRKRDLCAEKGIRLIFVFDSCGDIEKPPFDSDCYMYKNNLAYEASHDSLRALAVQLFNQFHLPAELTEDDWSTLVIQAKSNSQKMSQNSFQEKMHAINPDILVQGSYMGSSTPVLCLCKKCKHTWKVRPNDLLNKHRGCPKCGHKRGGEKLSILKRKSDVQFREELARVNPSIEVLDSYETGHHPVRCLCLTCRNEWHARPGNLLSGTGCPKCARKARRLTDNEVKNRLKLMDSHLSLLDRCQGMNQPVRFKCGKCGEVFLARPNNILHQGQQCPKCGGA